MTYDHWLSTEPDPGSEPPANDDAPGEPSEAVYEAVRRLHKEADLLKFMARCAVFPEEHERDERSVAYNLQSTLDHAHALVDVVHELRHAMGAKS